jgi:hypothetical protein
MICPECNQSFDSGAGACPRCGLVKGVVKSSTILISAGETRTVYRSVEDFPDRLKKQLLSSTNGLNSATIVIADRQGRKEIARAIRSLPVREPSNQPAPAPATRSGKLPLVAIRSAALILLVAVAALIWAIFR